METLNKAQEAAVNSSHPRILCLAGAGTGKTKTLTSRIARLWNDGVKTDQMLALTFTRAAGHEMKGRVIGMIGDEGKDLFCNTFHAFAAKLARRYAYKIGYTPTFTIYDEDDKTAMIEQIIEDYGYTGIKLKNVLKDISNITVYGTPIKNADTRRIYSEYSFRIRKNNAIDLDGLLTQAIRILQDATIQAAVREQYPYIFVDEFQDTDHRQMEILRLINPDNLFVVGDDFQSIYKFRGADVSIIMSLAEDQDYEVIKLEENYRSTIPIVTAANNLIKHNNQTEKILKSHREGEEVLRIECVDEEEELMTIEGHIWTAPTPSYNNIAVLGRTNRQIEEIHDYLTSKDIPCTIRTRKHEVLKGNDAKKIFAWMNAIVNKRDDQSVEMAMNYPLETATKAEKQKAEMFSLENDCSLYTALQATGTGAGFLDRYYDIEQRIAEDYDEEECVSAFDMCDYVVDSLAIREYYLGVGLTNRAADIDKIQEEIRRWQDLQIGTGDTITVEDWMEYYRMRLVDGELKEEEEEDAVQIMTAHGSKGLEFDTVIIAGCNQGTFPMTRGGDIEEERRLFYVAMTRAKNKLVLTRACTRNLFDFHSKDKEESQFLKELETY